MTKYLGEADSGIWPDGKHILSFCLSLVFTDLADLTCAATLVNKRFCYFSQLKPAPWLNALERQVLGFGHMVNPHTGNVSFLVVLH